jgi:tol-pal system protein YbgF
MKKLLLLPLLSLTFSACSDNKIDALELRLDRDLRQMREEIAVQNNQIEELRGELGRVTGKVEEVQYVASGRTQELEQSLRRVSSRVPPPPPVIESLFNEDERMIAQQSGPAAEIFTAGLQFLREGDFSNARDTFARFVEENPKTAFTDNAYLWQGISHEALEEWDRAVAAYSLGFQRFPAEDRVPACLFKLAESFERMGQKKDAQLTFEKLIEEHPRSEFTPKAKDRVSALKPKVATPPAKRSSPVKAPTPVKKR